MDYSSVVFYKNYLQEIFPNKTVRSIEKAIELVQTETPSDPPEYQLENVINLLTETGEGTFNDEVSASSQPDEDEECSSDETAGSSRISDQELATYYVHLENLFPDACPTYIRNLCSRKTRTFISLDSLIDDMVRADYPKREVDAQAVYEHLKEVLPKADPDYLLEQANSLVHQPEHELKRFIDDAVETEEYPTMEDYLKHQKELEEVSQYTTKFNVHKFLKLFPDPETYFNDPKRQPPLALKDPPDEEQEKGDEAYALNFLYNFYSLLRQRDIDRVFKMTAKNLKETCSKLDMMRKGLKTPRPRTLDPEPPKNVPLLQEIAYLMHRKEIKGILKEYNENYRRAKEEARANGLLQTCGCCFDEQLIPEECHFCKNGCIFCKDCVKGGAEAAIGEGKLDFPCLADCGSEFSIPTLQMVLDSVVFSRMAQRKQIEEIKRANLDGLETCPFCDFATIPPPDDKIFHCLNEECMKESCRECRHVAHIPLRCNEIEYDEDVKMRTYIENKMTEALLRRCWKCSKVFIKESGCNKMTCPCGAKMCYVCGTAVTDYQHFGESTGRCPLYTKDLNRFHANAVIQGATAAKAELGVDKNPNKLKIDPSRDIDNHYF